ncbi:hypothetical protein TKK_0019089 [Trichogramma kaykai]
MAVEMSVIKETKSADNGIIGLTRKDSTVLRWTTIRSILGQYSSVMSHRSKCSEKYDVNGEYIHEGSKKSKMSRDEQHFILIYDYVKNTMSDPFSYDIRQDILINMSTGLVATSEINNSLLNAKANGQVKLNDFISKRLDMNNNEPQSFLSAFHQNNLKRFTEKSNKTLLKINGKVVNKVISAEIVFQRALALSKSRKDVDLKKSLSLPLTSIPSSLFKLDGSKRSNVKSELLPILEKEVDCYITNQVPISEEFGIVIIDGMAELHRLSSESYLNFNDLGNNIFQRISHRWKYAKEVYLVFDRYDDALVNPKREKRERRYGKKESPYI